MRLISIIFILFKVTSIVFGQWTDLTSKRNDIVFINESTGWMAGSEGSLLKTTDGGKTWINQNSPIQYSNEQITKIAVFDGGNSLKVVTRKSQLSAVYISSDSGATWTRVAFNQYYNFDMHFISASVGWYWVITKGGNNDAVFQTTDGGNTWTQVPGLASVREMTSSGNNVWAIQHLDYFPGEQTLLWRSSDLGTNWTSTVIDPYFLWDYYLPDLQFFDSQNGWLCTNVSNGIYKTTDGGISWVQTTDAIFNNASVSEIFFVNSNVGYAYGFNSSVNLHFIYKTTDSGATWTIVNTRQHDLGNTPDHIHVLYFKDANSGIAAGDNGLYMETEDGGITWETKNHCTIGSNFPVNDIAFNGSDVWVVGENLVQTSNDGVTWKVYKNLLQSVKYEESAITFLSDGKGIMVTDLTYQRTFDNGITWNSFAPTFEYSGDIYNNRMWNDTKGNVWIQKANATLYKSEDDGQIFKISWKPSQLLGSDRHLEFQTDKKIWYYGETKLVKSIDGGVTWSQLNQTIQQLQFISEDIGFKLLEDRKIYKTIDGGENWVLESSVPHWSSFKFMFFADENVGWVGSTLGIVMKTIDGGKTWLNENTGMLNEYYDMAFARNNDGEIIGYLGGDGLLKLNTDYVPQPVINLGEVVLSIASSDETFVNLEWTDNSTIEEGFIIQRKLPGGVFTPIDTTTSTTFNDNSVELGKTYIYRVAIFKTDRVTHYSNEVRGPRETQQISFQEIPQKTYGDPVFALVATNSSGLPIVFTSNNESIASIEGNMATIHGVGEVTITASAAGNSDFLPAHIEQMLIVNKADQVITFGSIENRLMGSTAFDIIATATSGLAVQFFSASDHISLTGSTIMLLSPGSVTILANQEGDSYYNAAPPEQQTFCINPTKPIITASEVTFETALLTSSQPNGNQWYRNGEMILNETSASISISENGSYTVITSVEECSSDPSEPYVMVITGLDDERTKGSFLYPNPGTDKVKLDFSSFTQMSPIEIQIFDAQGREIQQLTLSGKSEVEFDINSFNKGAYILKASSNGNLIITRFLKQ